MKIIHSVSFEKVKINDGFFSPKIGVVCDKTIRACIEKCRQTGRITNFIKAASQMQGEFEGIFFNDSDVYKILEGVAYALSQRRDAELEREADEIIEYIAAAQQPDGYIQTYFTLKSPDQKWTDMNMHEDYCFGHLIEAGIAYKNATGKDKLLNVGIRAADLMCELFGPGKRSWISGHQEIELALVKLAQQVKQDRYVELAHFLLEQRGRGLGEGYIWSREDWGPEYCQDHLPVAEMSDVKGHSVRALYMFCGMADVARVTNNESYIQAMDRLWDSVVNRNMYITGGVGSTQQNEGFTQDYDLPNKEAYCETCAAIAMVYWNHRLNMMHGDAKYADIIETEIYNGALAGLSLSGDKFFYVNPLESDGGHNRVEWFDCSCCPGQVVRFIPSLGNYIYAYGDDTVYINQYISSSTCIDTLGIKLNIQGAYPFDGGVKITLEAQTAVNASVRLRIPSWCDSFKLTVNGESVDATGEGIVFEKGYIVLNREWSGSNLINIIFDMPVQVVHGSQLVQANRGKVAFRRGPVVYCAEQCDNANYDDIAYDADCAVSHSYRGDLLGGVSVLNVHGCSGNYKLVPYFAWDNRGDGKMKVWFDCK